MAAKDIMGEKFALLGMDAPMASWEIARISAPYADHYVASQATKRASWLGPHGLQRPRGGPGEDSAELGTVIAEPSPRLRTPPSRLPTWTNSPPWMVPSTSSRRL